MKKRLLYLFSFLIILLPMGVNAADATISLSCPASVKKNSTVQCNIVLDVTDGTINEVSGTIGVDNKFGIEGTNISIKGNFTGNSNIIKTFSVASKDIAGTGTITLSGVTATYLVEQVSSQNATINATASDDVVILNDNKNLTDIQIDGKSISTFAEQTFGADKLSYSIVLEKTSSVKVTGTLSDSKATISGYGTKQLVCGNNQVKLIVTAEDKTTKDYQISINRVCNTDITLKKITLSTGTLNPTFVSSTKNYTVNVSKDIDKITISADTNDTTQNVTGTVKDQALQFGENKFILKVTSESGTTGTYSVIVNREDSRSTNNYLSDLVLSFGKINFDKLTFDYNFKVLYDVTKLDITATPEDKTSKVEVSSNANNLKVGENTIIIKVIAEHGEEKEYKLVVNRLEEGETLGDNPNIETLEISNYDIDFNPEKTAYTLKIDNEKELDIEVTLEEKTASYTIRGNENLKNNSIITIKVTSEDGTVKDYKIVIEKSNSLLIIIIAGVSFLVATGLIVYLVIKNKKNNSDKVTTNKIKNKLKSEEEILSKVEQQLKQIENKEKALDITKPISIVPNNVNDISPVKEVEIIEDSNEIPKQEEIKKEDYIMPNPESTKVCSICGHRVSSLAKVCPYCRRKF